MYRSILFGVVAIASATRLTAQATDRLSLDVTIGPSWGSGRRQQYDNTSGSAGEVVLALRLHPDRAVAPIAALSVGGQGSFTPDAVCAVLPPPSTGCEPEFPSFGHLGIVGGIELRRAAVDLRALTGPAFYEGGGKTGLGAQINLDGAVGFAHLAFVAAVRGSLVDRFNGDRLWCRSLELGLRIQ